MGLVSRPLLISMDCLLQAVWNMKLYWLTDLSSRAQRSHDQNPKLDVDLRSPLMIPFKIRRRMQIYSIACQWRMGR